MLTITFSVRLLKRLIRRKTLIRISLRTEDHKDHRVKYKVTIGEFLGLYETVRFILSEVTLRKSFSIMGTTKKSSKLFFLTTAERYQSLSEALCLIDTVL